MLYLYVCIFIKNLKKYIIHIHFGCSKREMQTFLSGMSALYNICWLLSEVIININLLFCRSCFELLLSVPDNEISFEAWVQFHHSVQVQHPHFQDCLLTSGGCKPPL